MARIAGIDLPKDKRIEIGLTYIYGIGRKSAQDILAQTGINPDTRVKDLTEADEAKLREAIDQSYVVEGDLRRNVALDIKRLTEIQCYRGVRHRKGLPCRGQLERHAAAFGLLRHGGGKQLFAGIAVLDQIDVDRVAHDHVAFPQGLVRRQGHILFVSGADAHN